ncbi:CPBP family glutamic-type intramembrane protease [Pigmentiphaga aceris]|uniref:CPBP family glutamic-type intramembrane protease n=1 Tax=Pigmentiphaga aceris TaxID=1940612 RepID=UPI0016527A33|nr:CPBP family glutamic-type intramembrane protease [Pigmentiphaga aceris]
MSDRRLDPADTQAGKSPTTPGRLSLWRELGDFLAFLKHPTLRRGAGRLAGRVPVSGAAAEWTSGLALSRLLFWLVVLWTVNFMVLGPLAVGVADGNGVERVRPLLPSQWPYVVLWAPLVEEMLFRFWLRRPPGWPLYTLMAAAAFLLGPGWWLALIVVSLGAWRLVQVLQPTQALPWARLRRLRRRFPIYLHLSVLAFALGHLGNYQGGDTAWWLLPLVVLPQWFTGLVLAWMRVRQGIGAAIAMHAGFNSLPLFLLYLY